VLRNSLLFSRFQRGGKKYSEPGFFETGENGLKYETPKELICANAVKWKTKQKAIPKNPAKYPIMIYTNLIRRIWKLNE